MKISFLCFDLSGNSFGRAALLARALSRRHEVELLGPARNGSVWPPMRDLGLPVKLFPWKRLPWFSQVMQDMIRTADGDLIYACKPRLASFGAGLLAASGKPLILDIDDWELGFFYRAGLWGRLGRALNLTNPDGLPCTWLMEKLVKRADAVTVSNRFLQNRFGGELIYHCRDTSALDPAKHDPQKIRRELNLADRKIVMFLGTPRAHKGMDDLAGMMERVRHPAAHLVVVGAGPGDKPPFQSLLESRRATLVPQIPFDRLGDYLAGADAVVIPQRATSDTRGQMPAKIFDAMSMARPVVSTSVSDIPEVLGDDGYLADPGDPAQLASAVDRIFDDPAEAADRGARLRERCRKLYDLDVMEKKLAAVVSRFFCPGKKSAPK